VSTKNMKTSGPDGVQLRKEFAEHSGESDAAKALNIGESLLGLGKAMEKEHKNNAKFTADMEELHRELKPLKKLLAEIQVIATKSKSESESKSSEEQGSLKQIKETMASLARKAEIFYHSISIKNGRFEVNLSKMNSAGPNGVQLNNELLDHPEKKMLKKALAVAESLLSKGKKLEHAHKNNEKCKEDVENLRRHMKSLNALMMELEKLHGVEQKSNSKTPGMPQELKEPKDIAPPKHHGDSMTVVPSIKGGSKPNVHIHNHRHHY